MNDLEHVTILANHLSPTKQLQLVKYLLGRLSQRSLNKKEHVSLRGSWKIDFPEDFNLDQALQEIRDGWKKEMDVDV